MTKNCTTIEQSKKLVELGIDVNTADMCYIREQWWDNEKEKMMEDWCKIPVVDTDNDGEWEPLPDEPITLPAWSLSALLELIPCADIIKLDSTWTCGSIIDRCEAEFPIDACVEMIVCLKEKGF